MVEDTSPTEKFRGWLQQMRGMLDDTLVDLSLIDEQLPPPVPRTRSDLAKRWLRERRDNRTAFGQDADLFSDPAWDILLDLFVHRGVKMITVSSACFAANVPSTTALRWLKTLQQRDLIRRVANPGDQRSHLVTLTEKGLKIMNRILDDGLARFAG